MMTRRLLSRPHTYITFEVFEVLRMGQHMTLKFGLHGETLPAAVAAERPLGGDGSTAPARRAAVAVEQGHVSNERRHHVKLFLT